MKKVRIVVGSILGIVLFIPAVVCATIMAAAGMLTGLMAIAVILTLPEQEDVRYGKREWNWKGIKNDSRPSNLSGRKTDYSSNKIDTSGHKWPSDSDPDRGHDGHLHKSGRRGPGC